MHSILRTKKHKSIGSLKSREAHTYRTRKTPNALPQKLHLNKLLFGAKNYAMKCNKAITEYKKQNTVRSDAVLAIEYLLTTSPEFFEFSTSADRQKTLDAWCEAQVDFLKKKHGAGNILCVYLHDDEKTPHLEAYVVPIDSNGKLNCCVFRGS